MLPTEDYQSFVHRSWIIVVSGGSGLLLLSQFLPRPVPLWFWLLALTAFFIYVIWHNWTASRLYKRGTFWDIRIIIAYVTVVCVLSEGVLFLLILLIAAPLNKGMQPLTAAIAALVPTILLVALPWCINRRRRPKQG